MKKILSLILCGVLLLSLAGCNEPKVLSGSVRDRLPKRIDDTVVLADQSVHKLTFRETVDITGRNFHRYTDESNCTYEFDDHNVLIGFKNQYQGQLDDPSEKITKERAVEIATQHIKSVYGDILEGYVLSPNLETGSYYSVDFYTHYGTEGKIRGKDPLFVSVAFNGVVNSSTASWYGFMEGFDEKLVEGITFESLEPFVDKEAKAAFAENYVDSSVKEVYIEKENGKFSLEVVATVSTGGNGASVVDQLKSFSYPLG